MDNETAALNRMIAERAILRDALNRLWFIARRFDPANASYVNDATRAGTEHETELRRAIKQADDALEATNLKGNKDAKEI